MQKLTLLLLLFGISAGMWAQDVIFLRSGDEINAIVQKVGSTEVEYKKFSNPNGPTYTVPKSDVFIIKYKNGEKDVFKEEPTQKQPVYQQPVQQLPAQQQPVYQQPVQQQQQYTPPSQGQQAPPQYVQPPQSGAQLAAAPPAVRGAWQQKKGIISLGLGIDNHFSGTGFSTMIPPMITTFDFRLKGGLLNNKASIWAGVIGGINMSSFETAGYGSYVAATEQITTHFLFGGRGLFQYMFSNRLDAYSGIMLGYHAVRTDSASEVENSYMPTSSSAGGSNFSFIAGAHFWLGRGFGLVGEFNTGAMSYLTIGLSIGF
ncbi:MAG: hypothetical protein LBV41_02435 [Cytophagaceae bacterium]|jgi:hypothetical protein|nr:hypothetical protein [Cytophagaceae bacterium]